MKPVGAAGNDPTSTCATSPVENTLMAALPSDLRMVMKPITKYTDNVGGVAGANQETKISSTVDYLPLLAPVEITGPGKYKWDNPYEEYSQMQYKYYENGNSALKYNHSDISEKTIWWLRSPYNYSSSETSSFCQVNEHGSCDSNDCRVSRGIAPVFLV